jgi:hypothetical protein
MKITQRQLRQIIREELMREMRGPHDPDLRMGAGAHSHMGMDPIMADFGDPNEPDPDFDDYVYGDDPDEFMDLPAGEIMNRLRR